MEDLNRAAFLGSIAGAACVPLMRGQAQAQAQAKAQAWTSADPMLSGNNAPVMEELTLADLRVTGTVPRELDGMYLRNGPNPQYSPIAYTYPLDGDGMIHGITLREGRVAYRNRWVSTPGLLAERRAGRALYGSVARPIPVDAKYLQPGDDPMFKNDANTNVVRHAGKILALYEGGLPYELSPLLDTRGSYDFAGRVKTAVTAHPKVDTQTGDLHFFGYNLFQAPYVVYYVANAAGTITRGVPIDFPHPTIVHDCQITDRYIVFAATPLVFNLQNAMSGKNPMEWKPEAGTTFVLLDRKDPAAAPIRITTEPFYFWHYVNGFDQAGMVHLDFVRNDRAFTQGAPPSLHRVSIDVAKKSIVLKQLDDHNVEFPRVDPAQIGKDYRFAIIPTASPKAADHAFDGLLRYDAHSQTSTLHDFAPGRSPGEAAIVPKLHGRSPNDAWIMTFVYDAGSQKSDFIILDSEDFTGPAVATIHLPVRVPYGLHGNWIPA